MDLKTNNYACLDIKNYTGDNDFYTIITTNYIETLYIHLDRARN